MTTTFTETRLSREAVKHTIISEGRKILNPKFYHLLDTANETLEYYILYPCRKFNLSNIFSHEVIHDGLITYSLFIRLRPQEYDIEIANFEWVQSRTEVVNLNYLYYDYNVLEDLKFKVENYGILKSAEQSIVESMGYFSVIIQQIINKKAKT